eukprot:m.379580 g.379580  ORF g.379580 m.379580 type:complete len:80 (-) comp99031_c0_seq1:25-264(-)
MTNVDGGLATPLFGAYGSMDELKVAKNTEMLFSGTHFFSVLWAFVDLFPLTVPFLLTKLNPFLMLTSFLFGFSFCLLLP